MKHIFKPGGERLAACGARYTIEAVSDSKFDIALSNGWFASLEDAIAIPAEPDPEPDAETPEEGSEYEAELRAKIKSLGGKPAGRSSIEFLENQLAQLEAEQNGSDEG